MATGAQSMRIKVSWSKLDAGVQNINRTFGDLQKQFDDLQKMVQATHDIWDGAASAAYQGTQQEWNKLSGTMNRSLNEIGRAVTATNNNFQTVEQGIKSAWSSHA
jgi:WXG100 family type VII secretion target